MADVALLEQIPSVILKKLRSELGGTFKTYFDGDPIAIGVSQMPALVVDWERADHVAAPTRHDKWGHTIVVKAIVNKMDDTSTLEAPSTGVIVSVPTRKKLERLIFARRKDNGEYLPDTVLGVLRRNYTMEGRQSNNIANVEFGVSQRPSDGGNTAVTAEAHVRLTVNELQAITNRT